MPRDVRPRFRSGAVLLLGALTCCTYWKSEAPAGSATVGREASPRTVMVTRADGSRVKVRDARIARDTLTGLGEGRDTLRIALAEVVRVERRALDPARTILAFALFVGSIAVYSEMDNAEIDLR